MGDGLSWAVEIVRQRTGAHWRLQPTGKGTVMHVMRNGDRGAGGRWIRKSGPQGAGPRSRSEIFLEATPVFVRPPSLGWGQKNESEAMDESDRDADGIGFGARGAAALHGGATTPGAGCLVVCPDAPGGGGGQRSDSGLVWAEPPGWDAGDPPVVGFAGAEGNARENRPCRSNGGTAGRATGSGGWVGQAARGPGGQS